MRTHLPRAAVVAFGLAVAATGATLPTAAADTTGHHEAIAVADGTGEQFDFESSISGTAQVTSYDGTKVVFHTAAPLVATDDNQDYDVYLRDRVAGTTTLVSGTAGTPGNGMSIEPSISSDGRWVAYSTQASNLVDGTAGEAIDVVVTDLTTGTTHLASRTTGGETGRGNSFLPVISGDGRFVSFQSYSRLGPKDEDRTEDVYVHDLRRGRTVQVSLLPGTNRDIRGFLINGDISDDGRLVVFGNDHELWVRDLVTRTTRRFHQEPEKAPCNEAPQGSAGRPTISGDGRFVAFSSCSTDLVGKSVYAEAFRLELASGRLRRLTNGNHDSFHASLSRTGRFVSFGSDASDLVAGDTERQPDAFRLDVRSGETIRISTAPDGSGGDSWSATNAVAISGDGHTVVYQSYAQNLLPENTFETEEAVLWTDR